MEDPNKFSEPQDEKEAGKENPDENQPERETPETPEEEAPEEKPEEKPEPEAEKPDYENLYKESQREALILREQLKKHDSRRELTKEPAESELRAAFPDWDELHPSVQAAARFSMKAELTARDLAAREEAREHERRWNTDLEMAIAKNPSLQGKEAAFKEFAKKPTHRGAPMETLIAAFLYEAGKAPAPKTKTPAPALEPGNGGPRDPIESKKKYTAEEEMAIQTRDPRKYREMLLRGDFDD